MKKSSILFNFFYKYLKIAFYIISCLAVISFCLTDDLLLPIFLFPYVLVLIFFYIKLYIKKLKFCIGINQFCFVTVIFLCPLILANYLGSDYFQFKYKNVGNKIVVLRDMKVSHNQFFPFEITIYNNYKKILYDIKQGDEFTIKKQILTGHPDLNAKYIYMLSASNKEFEKKFINNAKKYMIKWDSISERYMKFSLERLYFDDSIYYSYKKNDFKIVVENKKKLVFWSLFQRSVIILTLYGYLLFIILPIMKIIKRFVK